MAKTNSLVNSLKLSFPAIRFTASDDFRWSPEEGTVYYTADKGEDAATLLHETAHGVLGHDEYSRDIDLLKLERDAWTHAQAILGPQFNIVIDDSLIEDALDSYRDWLHARSLCPDCKQTGVQTARDTYRCLACDKAWRTNEARRCGLRRYRVE